MIYLPHRRKAFRSSGLGIDKTGLSAWWDLADTGGTTFTDQHNGHDFTEDGAVTEDTDKWSDAAGCVLFNHVNDALRVSDHADFEAGNSNTEFSIAFWMYRDSAGGTGTNYLTTKYLTSTNLSYLVNHQGATFDRTSLWVSADGSTTDSTTGTAGSAPDDEWRHIVWTYDAGVVYLYSNGSEDSNDTLTATSVYNGTADFAIGHFSSAERTRICRLSFWQRPLSSTEVSTLYNSGNDVRYADL